MALVRCEHHGRPKGRALTCARVIKPVGWPETAVICGGRGCGRDGLIWLTVAESEDFDHGRRVFGFNNAWMKVWVDEA